MQLNVRAHSVDLNNSDREYAAEKIDAPSKNFSVSPVEWMSKSPKSLRAVGTTSLV